MVKVTYKVVLEVTFEIFIVSINVTFESCMKVTFKVSLSSICQPSSAACQLIEVACKHGGVG